MESLIYYNTLTEIELFEDFSFTMKFRNNEFSETFDYIYTFEKEIGYKLFELYDLSILNPEKKYSYVFEKSILTLDKGGGFILTDYIATNPSLIINKEYLDRLINLYYSMMCPTHINSDSEYKKALRIVENLSTNSPVRKWEHNSLTFWYDYITQYEDKYITKEDNSVNTMLRVLTTYPVDNSSEIFIDKVTKDSYIGFKEGRDISRLIIYNDEEESVLTNRKLTSYMRASITTNTQYDVGRFESLKKALIAYMLDKKNNGTVIECYITTNHKVWTNWLAENM